ncbi:MAG: MotA/TolQ/ExbB proton channel family protein [Saprospiraceae bacterium]|jgi:biopolymer transport protein ExbB|nr:MotA/TolQ/ExbB proton channel family protein [Saprospiraceae bacterium]MBK6477483.1 MotA/TolQ/ExbB proton channel family protein [Saprospiraceae bacterium]MBK7371169.1 MotA/TolQ/ExbB proton channel family protein [Saprospiraceae bacterium]MBK7436331.1 MotA/TolQ/ExbB proton channel family protein [Saprospiraceae bacterium]MBK8281239.1 MotA/TolQ/ExbB proton channel family protein [Saprospiraceae bacterium]
MLSVLLFQVSNLPQVQTAVESTGTQNLWSVLLQTGYLGIANIFINLVLSVIAIYIFVDRYRSLKRASNVDENFMNNIRNSVQNGNIDAAKNLCAHTDTPIARLIEKGLQRIGKPLRDIDAAIENTGNLELFRMEKNLSILASVAGAAPMIGFFGTVTGMIQAFYNMASQQNVTPSVLAGGIYQALITTAVGLAVGIFAYIAYNLLVSNVEKVVYSMERTTVEFMDLLQEPAK